MVYRSDPLDSAFGALADRTRRAILAQLAGGERSISEIARRFDMTLPAVSKHVYVLERAGLAEVRLEGRTRHCRRVAAPLRDAATWIDRYRGFWDASFDRLAIYLDDALARGVASSREAAGEFELRASAVVVTSGGIGHNFALMRMRRLPKKR